MEANTELKIVTEEDNTIDTVEELQEAAKKIYTSKTFWTNILALVVFSVQKYYGYELDAATQGMILSIVNVWLRTVTKEKVTW